MHKACFAVKDLRGRNIDCSVHLLAMYDIFQLLPSKIQVGVFFATMAPESRGP